MRTHEIWPVDGSEDRVRRVRPQRFRPRLEFREKLAAGRPELEFLGTETSEDLHPV